MRSQIVCASATVMLPGTTRWNSRKVNRPAWRERRSCASSAPTALSATSSRMRLHHRRLRRRVHQAADRRPHHPHAGPQHVHADAERQQRVHPQRSRSRSPAPTPSSTPAEVTTSVIRCCPSATSAGERSRRPVRISSQDQAPFSTVASAFSARPSVDHLQRAQRVPGHPGMLEDRDRGDDDQRALDDRREQLRLAMAVRVVGVGRHRRDPQRAQRQGAGHHVDDALQRVRIQRGAAGDPPGSRLQPQHQDSPGQYCRSRFALRVPPRPILPRRLLANPAMNVSRAHHAIVLRKFLHAVGLCPIDRRLTHPRGVRSCAVSLPSWPLVCSRWAR